ncbi:hypothetical protein FOG18_09980 [Legionella israelensis]|uniref:hypothetical protein n=1 Tax=Legionella israelensis TaxID=454 RepID=UPI00117FFB20|nr:hypothetical protein [Legionella israelensis]QDP72865.1 hypothetical protein FOG18_09980 [Legionella israelensis]
MTLFISPLVFFSVLMLFTATIYAANLPTTILGAEQYDETMCVEQYQDNCISSVCLTSEERDCPDKCRKMAKDKCREKFGGQLDVNNLTQ